MGTRSVCIVCQNWTDACTCKPVDLVGLVEAVARMRALQRRFFSGDKSVVAEAKRVERQVDRMIEAATNPQRRLF